MSGRLRGWQLHLGGYMTTRVRLRDRARYWFDNTMSRGTISLIFWLAIASAALIVTITVALALVEQPSTPDRPSPTLFQLLWDTFVSTFGLAVPDTGPRRELALWFLLALGGIFIVSALVGLLTTGLNLRLLPGR